jgi:hypothetical protein
VAQVEKQDWTFSQIGLRWVMKTMLERARVAEAKKLAARQEAAAAAAVAPISPQTAEPTAPPTGPDCDFEAPSGALVNGFIIASDNCSAQFKCRHSLLGMSRLPRLVLNSLVQSPLRTMNKKISTLWLWAGAGFFKWRHDTAGGWLKREASKDVLKGERGFFRGSISGAEKLVEFGNLKLAKPTHTVPKAKASEATCTSYELRVRENHFLDISAEDIKIEDAPRADEKSAVTHTQQLHGCWAVSEGRVKVCDRPCSCAVCRADGDAFMCENKEHKAEWRDVLIRPEAPRGACQTRQATTNDGPEIAETPDDDGLAEKRPSIEILREMGIARPWRGEWNSRCDTCNCESTSTTVPCLYCNVVYCDSEECLPNESEPIVGTDWCCPQCYEEYVKRHSKWKSTFEQFDCASWTSAIDGLSGGDDIAIMNYSNPAIEYFLLKLAADPWHTVGPRGLVCTAIKDAAGASMTFCAGERVLKGYFYSRRSLGHRLYDLQDATYASKGAPLKEQPWPDWPLVYFSVDLVLYFNFHMIPVMSKTRRQENWFQFDGDDEDATIATLDRVRCH